MVRRQQTKIQNRARLRNRSLTVSQRSRFSVAVGRVGRGAPANHQGPFVPPEDWHEPNENDKLGYRVVRQKPGTGYRHVLSESEIRERLAELPTKLVRPLEVVQLSRMTRKKRTYPCYGMQWGTTIYLYPVDEGLVEYYDRPPCPAVYNETRVFGGRWYGGDDDGWRLEWSEEAIRDYYLNNVLIHELGHLLDQRNTSYRDRERFAEWFAVRYGYSARERRQLAAQGARKMVRRHHST